jgi:hypothetical protein
MSGASMDFTHSIQDDHDDVGEGGGNVGRIIDQHMENSCSASSPQVVEQVNATTSTIASIPLHTPPSVIDADENALHLHSMPLTAGETQETRIIRVMYLHQPRRLILLVPVVVTLMVVVTFHHHRLYQP